MSDPELSRPVRADTIGTAPRVVDVEADDSERLALARRFGLGAIERLQAQVSVVRAEPDILVTGTLSANVTQSCVVTGEPVQAGVDESFAIRFRLEPLAGAPEEEVELGDEELDVMFHDGAMVDVGEAVAQTLALNLDPYPRAAEAGEALKLAGVKSEGEAGPFGGLAALKDKLGGA